MKKMIGLLTMTVLSSYAFCQETLQSVTDRDNNTTNGLRVTAAAKLTGGAAVELYYGDNAGNLAAYDRNASVFKPLFIQAQATSFPNGNVGIGTTSPQAKLHVRNGAILATDIDYDNIGVKVDGTLIPGISFTRWTGSGNIQHNAFIGQFHNQGLNEYSFGIGTGQSETGNQKTNTNILTATLAGNIGIGTTTPAERLAVNGNISLSNRLLFFDGTLFSDANNMASFHNGGFVWSSADNSTVKMQLSATGDLFVSGNQIIGRDWAQRNLDVNGNIKTRKIKVTQTDWADYVFDSSYQLPSLPHLETFVKENKHLPEVPSAAEVRKDGLDLGDNQVVLLKKIEELTLYIIQQNKEITELKKRMSEMEVKQPQ